MSSEVIVYIAASLDGYIARSDGSIDWLDIAGPEEAERSMSDFVELLNSVDCLVMGRKTWESKEVDRRPLPNRINVVVSRSEQVLPPGVIAARTLDEALAVPEAETIFVVGGAGLLNDALAHPDLRYIYLTRVDGAFECDVKMPDLDAAGFVKTDWEGELRAEEYEIRYRIERLRRP